MPQRQTSAHRNTNPEFFGLVLNVSPVPDTPVTIRQNAILLALFQIHL
jgi:hypothetical protein